MMDMDAIGNLARSALKEPDLHVLLSEVEVTDPHAIKQKDDVILSASVARAADGPIVSAFVGSDADPVQPVEVDDRTLYNIGSISKFVIMNIIMRMAQDKVIALDSSIDEAWPGHTLNEQIEDVGKITIRQLLGHRSSLYDTDFTSMMDGADPLLELRKFPVPPDTAGIYANVNYVILAHIVEAASGQSLHEAFMHYVGTPLDLENTFARYSDISEGRKSACGFKYNHEADTLDSDLPREILGAASFHSTPTDLCMLIKHFFEDDRYMLPHSRSEVLTFNPSGLVWLYLKDFDAMAAAHGQPGTPDLPAAINARQETCGEGWIDISDGGLGIEKNGRLLGHKGWKDGSAGTLFYDPDSHTASCVLISKTQGQQHRQEMEAAQESDHPTGHAKRVVSARALGSEIGL